MTKLDSINSTYGTNYLTCECKSCLSGNEESRKLHYHEVKDYYPDIKWKTNKAQLQQEIRDIMKSYGCNYEKAKSIQRGEKTE